VKNSDELSDNPPFFDLVSQVRAMRRLKTDPVPMEKIRKILQAGVQATSAQNTQPWRFLALTSVEQRQWFGEHYRRAMYETLGSRLDVESEDKSPRAREVRTVRHQVEHMGETPLIVLVAGKRDWPFKVPESERVGTAPPSYGSVYPCVQNILLACRSLGLGAALTTMHQMFEDELHQRFNIPHDHGVVVALPIGYPEGNFGPVTRTPASEVTYFNRWDNFNPDERL